MFSLAKLTQVLNLDGRKYRFWRDVSIEYIAQRERARRASIEYIAQRERARSVSRVRRASTSIQTRPPKFEKMFGIWCEVTAAGIILIKNKLVRGSIAI